MNTREATQSVKTTKLTRLIHKIAVHLHLVAENCTIYSSHSRQPVQKLLDIPSYFKLIFLVLFYIILSYSRFI
jgi:hypothetical protein